MILRPIGGLGNRLRAIMSRLEPDLVVQWPTDWEVAYGKWEDIFEPLPDVTIVNVTRQSNDSFVEPCDLETCNPATRCTVFGWGQNYRLLCPSVAVRDRLREWNVTDYDAIHVRRTDHSHVVPPGGFTIQEEFDRFVESTRRTFLATDNEATQSRFLRVHPNIFYQRIESGKEVASYGDHTRHTSLVQSAVDMWLCVYAKRFMGTRYSSFTETINILRALR